MTRPEYLAIAQTTIPRQVIILAMQAELLGDGVAEERDRHGYSQQSTRSSSGLERRTSSRRELRARGVGWATRGRAVHGFARNEGAG